MQFTDKQKSVRPAISSMPPSAAAAVKSPDNLLTATSPVHGMRFLLVIALLLIPACVFARPAAHMSLNTGEGTPINVLKAGEEDALAIRVKNTGKEALVGEFLWDVKGVVLGKSAGQGRESLHIEPGEEREIRLTLAEALPFDAYTVDIVLRNEDRMAADLKRQLRFGYMIPSGPTQGRAEGFIFGLCEHPQRYSREHQERLAMAAAWCGAKAVREDIDWGRMQPKEGEWNFAPFDYAIAIFESYGIELLPIYAYSARWAIAEDWVPMRESVARDKGRPDFGHWRIFVREFVKRYGDRVRFLEIWNEPDLTFFANFPADDYLKMQAIAYEEIKAVNPEITVLNGGIAHTGSNISGPHKGVMDKILASDTFDVFAFHGHGRYPAYRHQIAYVNKKLENHRAQWYANETAVSATGIGEIEQAKTLFQKLIYSWAQGSIGYNWYNLRNKGFDPRDGEHNFGLITHDFKPKAAYLTYNTLASHFKNAEFLREFSTGQSIRSYSFMAENGDYLLTFWCEPPEVGERLLSFGGITSEAEVIDILGNRQPLVVADGQIQFKVSPDPVFLRIGAQATGPQFLGEPLQRNAFFLASPGAQSELKFNLVNTTGKEKTFSLSGALPEDISGEIEATYQLAAGKKRAVTIPVHIGNTFHSDTSAPKKLLLTLNIDGFPAEELECPFATETPIPYGRFGQRPSFLLDTARQYHSLIVNHPDNAHLHWKGPEDLSAEVWLARRDEHLLLDVVVTDDVHYQKEHGRDVWQADNVQFAIKLPRQNIFWEIGLTLPEDGSPEVFIWSAPEGFDAVKSAERIQLEASRDENTRQTHYKARIPYDAIGLSEGIGRAGFRFNLIVNDSGHGVREGFIMVAPGIGEDKDTAKYPLVRFVPYE